MESREGTDYRPLLREGARVRLARKDDPNSMNTGTVMNLLPNQSKRKEHQWYDVRFDNGAWGRFLERYLDVVDSVTQPSAA
jgi:hypothetical protein